MSMAPRRTVRTAMLVPTNWAGRVLRKYSAWEIIIDHILLALGLVLGVAGAIALVAATAHHDWRRAAAFAVYGVGLVLMLGCSLSYHFVPPSNAKEWLRRFDHAAIFLMIAGTYTPFAAAHLEGVWSASLTIIVWLVAVAGAALKMSMPRQLERLSILAYLLLGLTVAVALVPFLGSLSAVSLALFGVGAVLYVVGVAFHMWDALPFQNVLWHALVIAAAACHYAAIYLSVGPPSLAATS